MRNKQRCTPRLLVLPVVLVLLGCGGNDVQPDPPPSTGAGGELASHEIARSADLGLPTRLLPAGFGTPEYLPPRGSCADILRDPDDAAVELRLTRQYTRRDQWETGDTTVTARYAEGIYSVSPERAYGLEPGDMLRVNCARQAATAVLSPIE